MVTPGETSQLLRRYKAGEVDEAGVLRLLCAAPIDDLGFAQVDAHRSIRQGFPEVIFGPGKTPEQVAAIAAKVMEREERVLVTRANADHADAVRGQFPDAVHHESARCIAVEASRLAISDSRYPTLTSSSRSSAIRNNRNISRRGWSENRRR